MLLFHTRYNSNLTGRYNYYYTIANYKLTGRYEETNNDFSSILHLTNFSGFLHEINDMHKTDKFIYECIFTIYAFLIIHNTQHCQMANSLIATPFLPRLFFSWYLKVKSKRFIELNKNFNCHSHESLWYLQLNYCKNYIQICILDYILIHHIYRENVKLILFFLNEMKLSNIF